MKTKNSNKLIFYLAPLIVMVVAGVIFNSFSTNKSGGDLPLEKNPEEVVRVYFKSWNDGDYNTMYNVISDGFKKIEPTAKDLDSFVSYATSQDIKGVTITRISETLNNGKTAIVDYTVEFELTDSKKAPFEGTFTLKYRNSDRVPGWKLIHPYGENIDTS